MGKKKSLDKLRTITMLRRVRNIIKKHNNEDRFACISTLAPAKEILDYIYTHFTT
jgi:hypothetical protein